MEKSLRHWMDILKEAPIVGWEVDPDLDKNDAIMKARYKKDTGDHLRDGKPFTHWSTVDKKAIENPISIKRIKHAFAKCPTKFNLFFVQSTNPDYDNFLEKGEVDLEWIVKTFGEDIAIRINKWIDKSAINVIFTNNLSDDHKIPFTSPWIIAHRIAHVLFSYRYFNSIVNNYQNFMKYILSGYGLNFRDDGGRLAKIIADENLEFYGPILGSKIGTMKSARDNHIVNDAEFFRELVSQYIISGKILFNDLPNQLDDDTKLTTRRDKLEKIQQKMQQFPIFLSRRIAAELKRSVGKIFVM